VTLDVLGILPAGGMAPACLNEASFATSANFLNRHLAIDDVLESNKLLDYGHLVHTMAITQRV
jgi:hypothetical protein